MFRRMLLAAVLAGGIGGLFASALQAWQVVPLIHAAERYEAEGRASHGGGAHGHAEAQAGMGEPEGAVRVVLTVVSNLTAGIGFALVLIGAMAIRGAPVDARRGVAWGLGGFAAFAAAPALGLPPELPGTMAADLFARQGWWAFTAMATAGALWLLAFRHEPPAMAIGVGLLALPHLVGAPHAEGFAGVIPAELAARYAAAVLVTAGLFWVALGALAGHFWRRLGSEG